MQSQEIKKVILDQQVEVKKLKASWHSREKSPELQSLLKSSGLVKVVMGIRRSGKSTLCLGSIPAETPFSFVNFDDERLTGLDTTDLNTVYEALLELQPESQILIFDEIQNIKAWELFVNRLQRKKINILITGSNGKLLSQELATHLTGRHLSLELMPLSFREFLEFRSISVPNTKGLITEQIALLRGQFQSYFELGGFPEVVLGEPQGSYLRELFDKIITRDIAQRYKLRSTRILKELALYLAQQSGSFASLGKLQKAFDIKSTNTVRNYFEYLKEVYLFFEVHAYSHKLKERSTRPRKFYISDLGLWSALSTRPTDDLGMKLETLVFLHLRRNTTQVYYLKEDGIDVDFCLTHNRKLQTLIQVCYTIQSESTRDREIRSLIKAAQRYKVKSAYLITWDEEDLFNIDSVQIQVIPAWKFFLNPLSLVKPPNT